MPAILITGAASAEAYKLERILKAKEVVFADNVDLPGAMFSSRKFIRIPPGSSPSFAHQLLRICLDLDIVKVYPLREEEILPLTEARQLLKEYGISVITAFRL